MPAQAKPHPTLAFAAVAALLTSCAWNTVLTPYAVEAATRLPAGEVATVWGVRHSARLYFTHVDGESMPSRGGAGYPVSLTLAPGKHTLRVFYSAGDNRGLHQTVEATLVAGHTYVVDHLPIPGTGAVLLKLSDLGKGEQCHYEPVEGLRAAPVLRCSGRAQP